MKLDTTISLSLLFSFIAMIGNLIAIYGIFERKHDKDSDREIDITKNFVKVNMKLDEFCRSISDLSKNTDKTTDILSSVQQHMIKVDSKLDSHDQILADHSERLNKLEGKVNE